MSVEYLIIFFARARVRRGKKGKNRKKPTAMASLRQNRKILSFPPFKAAASGKSTRAMPVVSSDVIVKPRLCTRSLRSPSVRGNNKKIYIYIKKWPDEDDEKACLAFPRRTHQGKQNFY